MSPVCREEWFNSVWLLHQVDILCASQRACLGLPREEPCLLWKQELKVLNWCWLANLSGIKKLKCQLLRPIACGGTVVGIPLVAYTSVVQPRFQSWGGNFLVWGITTLLQNFFRKVYPDWRSLLPPPKSYIKVAGPSKFLGSGPPMVAPMLHLYTVVKVVVCSRGGSASEVETHKNIDSVLLTKTTFQAHSIFSVSIQK